MDETYDTYNGARPTVWMRSLRDHTYLGKPQPEGALYLAHEDIVETIETLKFAVRDTPPPRAVRPTTPEPTPEPTPKPEAAEPMTTATTAPLTPRTRTRR